jgi:hypothetical protein
VVDLGVISVGDEFTVVYGATESFSDRQRKLDLLLFGKSNGLNQRQIDRGVKQLTPAYGNNGTLNFDPRCNPWAIKFLCSYWGTNSWRLKGGGSVRFTHNATNFDAYVHVDIAVPMNKYATVEQWKHGSVSGPRVVVSGYQRVNSPTPTQLSGKPAFALSPQEIYQIALLQFENCYRNNIPGDDSANLQWPEEIKTKIKEKCFGV